MTWQLYGNERFNDGKEEGKAEEKRMTALEMLRMGLTKEQIRQAIKLSTEENETIEKERLQRA